MKLGIVLILAGLVPALGSAEEKDCSVKGMHCEACIDMVRDKVCNDQYEVCTVTLKDKKGVIHIKTKDAAAKIDEKLISQAMADTTYKVDKCKAAKSKATM